MSDEYSQAPPDWKPRHIEDEVCTGMDIPINPWTVADIAYWTGTPTYQPWKDVAKFFRIAVAPAEPDAAGGGE